MNSQVKVNKNKIDNSSQIQYSRQREVFRQDLQKYIEEREQKRMMGYVCGTQRKKIG